MGSTTVVEKTEEELRKEIEELHRQQWEITERLRDSRGIRRGGLSGSGPRNFATNGVRRRPADRTEPEVQPASKRRLSSAVVKVEEGEITEEAIESAKNAKEKDSAVEGSVGGGATGNQSERKTSNWSNDGNRKSFKMDFETEHVPRVLPKDEDSSLVKRNKRMLGQLLGTLEAEQKAREESERLRQQEREQIAEKRKRDLTLRARVAAKAEEKKLELMFLRWSEHYGKLGNFIRTKAQPPIYYVFAKPLDEDATLVEQRKEEIFQEWKAARREELSQYQKQLAEQYVANTERDLERWQNARKGRKSNNDMANLQETMDKELETHRLEHGPKKRKIPGGSNNEDEEDDVEDMNVGEDDMMDDVLDIDETVKPESGNSSLQLDNKDQ